MAKQTTIHSIILPPSSDSDEPWVVGGGLIITIGLTIAVMLFFSL